MADWLTGARHRNKGWAVVSWGVCVASPLFWPDDLVCSCGLQPGFGHCPSLSLSSSRTDSLSQVERDR